MAWGLGSFLVLVVLMRVWLFPKLKKGMDARYAKTRGDLDEAERIREEAADRRRPLPGGHRRVQRRGRPVARASPARRSTPIASVKVTAANARIAERRSRRRRRDRCRPSHAALASTEPIVLEVAVNAAEPCPRRAGRPRRRPAGRDRDRQRWDGGLMHVLASIALFAQETTTEFHAENKWFPESAEIIWGTIAFVIIVGAAVQVGRPSRSMKAMQGRTDRIADEIEGAADARAERRGRGRPDPPEPGRRRRPSGPASWPRRPRPPSACASRASPATTPRSPSWRPGPRPTSRRCAAGPAASCRRQDRRRGPARPPSASCVSRQLDDATLQRLIEDYIAGVGAASPHERASSATASTATPRRCSRSPRPRATSTRSKTSCSASPARSRLPTSCATPSPTSWSRPSAARPSSRTCSARKASPTTIAAGQLRRRLRPRPRPAGHHRQARRAGRRREGPRRSPRSARPSRSPTTSSTAWPPPSPTPPASRSR